MSFQMAYNVPQINPVKDMKEQILKVAQDLERGTIDFDKARNLLLGLFGVSGSLPVEKVNDARYEYATDYPSELRATIEDAHLKGQMFVMKQCGIELDYGNNR